MSGVEEDTKKDFVTLCLCLEQKLCVARLATK